jgi:capsular polysaccharide biosynthesis protein
VDINQLVRSMLRRWYLFVLVLPMAVGAGVAMTHVVPPTYTITSNVVLIPPKSTEDPNANRLLLMSGLGQAVDVLVRSIDSQANHEAIGKEQSNASFTVAADATTSAPVVVVTGDAASAEEAEAVVDTVLQRIPRELDRLQENLGIAEGARITSTELSGDLAATANTKGQARAVAVVSLMVLGLGILLILIVDGVLIRRRDRRGAQDHVPPESAAADRDPGKNHDQGADIAARSANGHGRGLPAPPTREREGPDKRRKRSREDRKTLSAY